MPVAKLGLGSPAEACLCDLHEWLKPPPLKDFAWNFGALEGSVIEMWSEVGDLVRLSTIVAGLACGLWAITGLPSFVLFSDEGDQAMRPRHLVAILVLLMLVLPAAPSHADGVISICDEAHLLAALAGGGTVTFTCSGTIPLSAEILIAADTAVDGTGQAVTISGNNAVRVFTVGEGVTLNLKRW